MSDSLSSLPKTVPTLQGTESFTNWRRAVTAYLVEKGAHRVLEGRGTELFRDPAAALPAGEVAGDEQPDVTQSRTGAALTAAQRTQWEAWATREPKARSVVMLTVSHSIQAEIMYM